MTTREISVGQGSVSFQTGKLAKQAGGSVIVRSGDSVVLVTACRSSAPREGIDFLPLTVDYREYTYASGRIPGGFFKREGKPSEKEVLTSRMIDRPVRPLFPGGWRYETQIIALVLSADSANDTDVLAITGASAALALSDIPFQKTIAGVRVGLVDDQFVINPTIAQLDGIAKSYASTDFLPDIICKNRVWDANGVKADLATSGYNTPVVGDLTGDGQVEYTISGASLDLAINLAGGGTARPFSHLLGAWDARTGRVLPGFPRVIEDYTFFVNPAIADVNRDGYAERARELVLALDACGACGGTGRALVSCPPSACRACAGSGSVAVHPVEHEDAAQPSWYE